ncbi:MAG: ribonuclease G [Gammaproteobacteria bacterium]|nr:ribonuclease G [Gammaproteobacteria bacterium]
MSEEVLVNVTPEETRVAVVENGVLQEVHVERSQARGIVGNLFKGRVVRILPGMQAAFIDIGLERTAFLHATDITRRADPALNHETEGEPDRPIHELLHDGQEVVVQVLKDPLGSKGARLTTQISIPARFLVYLPYGKHIGISQKIENPEERDRLRRAILDIVERAGQKGGFIVRTVAETVTAEDLALDVEFLSRVWQRIEHNKQTVTAPSLIHADIPLSMRTMRDLVRDNVEKVRIDSRESYENAVQFARDLIPEVAGRIEYYPGERPIFDLYSVEDEIQRALDNKVPLKSGGYLVIDQTEAMTTVDVNTGAFIGRRNLEETLFKTNLEAAQAIARQLRLRNIGGIIIIDFIDMEDSEHRRQVMRALEKALTRDRIKTFVTEMSTLGLVEITRKRVRESLERTLCEPCPICRGRGILRTPQTVCYEIFREILREARQYDAEEFLVLASQVVVDMLLDEEATGLADLQEFIGKPIHLQVEVLYHQEEYDVVLT